MAIPQRQFEIAGLGNNRSARIIELLNGWPAGTWCPMPELARAISPSDTGIGICVPRAVYEARKALEKIGYTVVNHTTRDGMHVHSFYKIVKRADAAKVEDSTGTPTL